MRCNVASKSEEATLAPQSFGQAHVQWTYHLVGLGGLVAATSHYAELLRFFLQKLTPNLDLLTAELHA
jgi:hypothetical protein